MAFSLLPCFDSTLSALLEEEQNVCPDTKLIPPINETLATLGYYQAANGEVSIEQFGQPRLPQSIDEPLLAMQMSSTAPISMPNFHAALLFEISLTSKQNGGNNQDLVNGCNGSPPTLPPTEVSGLDDSTFKVVRLSAEQRKEKIHRYIKKRNKRNFSKKIKYACRKTLADSRPRVRGRFAKNEELCEATRSSSQNYDEYGQIAGAHGEDMLDTSDILAHLSGINNYSYKYLYTIESWI
ncbi:putative zinc finger protein CONSTANS-LIKE 11 [Hordeum vulgare subsp. vulgare]|uniref:putative zinc finger protein CONSTANS-LIKE 11 n=1 Tax=Hordeum vulgare subsp. vulgare TaxID=112509 RepID=UPI001D1A384E|nr:putative zinc finger protein CONSTANS-LIKE 11 [Hordeum vulgare subsp. vulgare]